MPRSPKPSPFAGKLGSFIPEADDLPPFFEAALADLHQNPDQPRQVFDEALLEELARSIEEHGLLQPIVVTPRAAGGYLLVAGERRFRAFQRLGRATIPALLLAEGSIDELALIENLQREDLHPLEAAEALRRLLQRHGYGQVDLARILGKSKATVSELLSLTELPVDLQAEVRTSELSKSALVELARIKDPDAQREAWAALRQGSATTRVARAIKRGARPKPTPSSPGDRLVHLANDLGVRLAAFPSAGALPPEDRQRLTAALRTVVSNARKLLAKIEAEGAS